MRRWAVGPEPGKPHGACLTLNMPEVLLKSVGRLACLKLSVCLSALLDRAPGCGIEPRAWLRFVYNSETSAAHWQNSKCWRKRFWFFFLSQCFSGILISCKEPSEVLHIGTEFETWTQLQIWTKCHSSVPSPRFPPNPILSQFVWKYFSVRGPLVWLLVACVVNLVSRSAASVRLALEEIKSKDFGIVVTY